MSARRLSARERAAASLLRSMLLCPGRVWLVTDPTGARWLTDSYVGLKVGHTDRFAPGRGAETCTFCDAVHDLAQPLGSPEHLPDGQYQLTATYGLVRSQPATRSLDGIREGLLRAVGECEAAERSPVTPTEWAVLREADAAAQLWDREGVPVWINAGIAQRWASLVRAGSHTASQAGDRRPVRIAGKGREPAGMDYLTPQDCNRDRRAWAGDPGVPVAYLMPIDMDTPAAPRSLAAPQDAQP